MKLKETIMIAIAALAFMLITGVAKAEDLAPTLDVKNCFSASRPAWEQIFRAAAYSGGGRGNFGVYL